MKKTRSRSAPQHWSHGSRPNWWSIYLIPVMCVCVSGGWLPDPTGVLQLATQPAHILHIRSTTQVIIFKNLRLRALFNTFQQCCGAEPFFLGSGSRYFFWLRLQVKKNLLRLHLNKHCADRLRLQKTDFDTKHLKNLNFNK